MLGKLDSGGLYGVWWYNRREARTVRVPLGGGRYRKTKRIRKKPEGEWIPVPVPASGVSRETVVQARERLEGRTKSSKCPDALLGALGRFSALPGLPAGAHCGLCMEGLHEEGRDSQEALPLRLRHPSPEGEGGLLLLEDPERPQDRDRGVGGSEGGAARSGAPRAWPRHLYLQAEKKKVGGDPEKEARALINRIAEIDRKRDAYQDLAADGLMERKELRAKLDALSCQKAATEEGLNALKERRRKIRELELSREKVLASYRDAVPEGLEKVEGKKRCAVYNALGVIVWAARAKGDPIRIVFGALGGEEVCRSDVTSTR